MRQASLPTRLDRLAGRHVAGDRERTVREVSAEYGLDPAEVRAEVAAISDHARRFGPRTPAQVV